MINTLARLTIRYNLPQFTMATKIKGMFSVVAEEKGFTTRRVLEAHVTRFKYDSYFGNKNVVVSDAMAKIIEELNPKSNKNIKEQQAILSDYLEVHNTRVSNRPTDDILALLVAINMHGHEKLLAYRVKIFQFLLRRDLQTLQLDMFKMHCFIDVYQKASDIFAVKRKTQHVIYTYMVVLLNNMEQVHFSYYITILNLTLESQGFNPLSFLKIAHCVQQHIFKKIESIIDGTNNNVHLEKFLKSDILIMRLIKNISTYNCPPGHFPTFYSFLDKYVIEDKLQFSNSRNLWFLLQLYRNMPVREKNQEGQYYKRLLLNKIIPYAQKYNINHSSNERTWQHFLSTIIHHIFYEHWMGLTFCQSQGLIFLEKEQLKYPPELPDIFWKIYHSHPSQINMFSTSRSIIQQCYPSMYKETEVEKSIEGKQPSIETQMRIRMEMALMKLDIDYEKEKKMLTRHTDFLIEDNIVLQIDGVFHFYPTYFENNDVTILRNLHLLYSGYKLIVINIFEYNKNRQTDKLAALLQKKLKKLKEGNYVAVL